jgi:hypothetical protein
MINNSNRPARIGLPGILWCAAILVLGSCTIAHAEPLGDPQYKVAIQVSTDDPTTQRIALNNAANLQKEFGMDNSRIEIVAYGPGLSILTQKSQLPERVESLISQGIRFSACHNTMEGIKRKTGHLPKLLENVEVVPSGVARIVELQQQGYAYVRP